jgi:allantoinase
MDAPDLVVRGQRVVTGGELVAASVYVRGGVIDRVAAHDDPTPPGASVVEAGDAVVMPGLVDTHVHVNEPGRTEWEGFDSATRGRRRRGHHHR